MTKEKTKSVYFFKNTCPHCCNDIEYPLLGDFSYGELIFQTTNAQQFALAVLIDNNTFNFICDSLKSLNNKKADPHYILARVADTLDGQEFTNHTLCPICQHKQRNFMDNFRKRIQEIPFVTWHVFEGLGEENKKQLIVEILNGQI